MYTIITLLVVIVLAQALYISAVQRSHFGVLIPSALRLRLAIYSALRVRVFCVGFDIRKMKSGNTCAGYDRFNGIVGRLVSTIRRGRDVVGQFGGDEFVVIGIYSPGSAEKVVSRLIARRDEINAGLPDELKAKMFSHSGGLVDGLHFACAYISDSRDASAAARACIDATEPLKSGGRETGNRDTSGKEGTLIMSI